MKKISISGWPPNPVTSDLKETGETYPGGRHAKMEAEAEESCHSSGHWEGAGGLSSGAPGARAAQPTCVSLWSTDLCGGELLLLGGSALWHLSQQLQDTDRSPFPWLSRALMRYSGEDSGPVCSCSPDTPPRESPPLGLWQQPKLATKVLGALGRLAWPVHRTGHLLESLLLRRWRGMALCRRMSSRDFKGPRCREQVIPTPRWSPLWGTVSAKPSPGPGSWHNSANTCPAAVSSWVLQPPQEKLRVPLAPHT